MESNKIIEGVTGRITSNLGEKHIHNIYIVLYLRDT